MTSLTVTNTPSAELVTLIEDTLDYAAASRADSTARQYQSNWKGFTAFCVQHGLTSMPASVQTVCVYLTHLAKSGKATSTVDSHFSAIKYFHDRARVSVNWQDPILSEVLAGIRRSSTRKVEKAAAILPDDLLQLLEATADIRDRTLILLGFAGAFRRSELVGINVEDIEFTPEGMVIQVHRSKTDQVGKGAEVCIPFAHNNSFLCAVNAVKLMINALVLTKGPLFCRCKKGGGLLRDERLSEESVRLILMKAVKDSGLDKTGRISPHSLRAGFCTTAALGGKNLEQIARHARHSSTQTTLGYVRVAERFKDHAGSGLL